MQVHAETPNPLHAPTYAGETDRTGAFVLTHVAGLALTLRLSLPGHQIVTVRVPDGATTIPDVVLRRD